MLQDPLDPAGSACATNELDIRIVTLCHRRPGRGAQRPAVRCGGSALDDHRRKHADQSYLRGHL